MFGVEAQGDWANLTGSNASLTVLIPATNRTKIDAIGLFTGQVGYAWNNALLYVKGGAAVTDNKYSTFFTASGVVYNQATDTRWGGVVGTGIEFGFAPNWSVGVEYDHLFMGNPNVTFPATNIAVSRSRQYPSGRGHGNGPGELPLWWSRRRKVLISPILMNSKAPASPTWVRSRITASCMAAASKILTAIIGR